MDIIRETAITINYDEDKVYVDTSVRSIATRLRQKGFVETGKSGAYTRFRGDVRQVSFLSATKRRGRKPSA